MTQTTQTNEIVSTENRPNIWQGLGGELTPGGSISEWQKEAGMDWDIIKSTVIYHSMSGTHTFGTHTFPDKQVLFRSDTNEPLAVMSNSYHIVQPRQILEFFSNLVQRNGFQLNAAGTLFGGRRFWATADLGKVICPVYNDDVHGQLLLLASADGSSKTVAKFVSARGICNNTLTIAMGDAKQKSVSKTHHAMWNPEEVKLDMDVIDVAWQKFSANIKKLAKFEVTDSYVQNYFHNKFYNPSLEDDKQTWGAIKKVNTLMDLYRTGVGSEYSRGTAWGILNAVTELGTRGTREKQDPSRRFWESAFGNNDTLKSAVYNDMVAQLA
jgi:phage/plasmid-like protein (TIGR03299 family)